MLIGDDVSHAPTIEQSAMISGRGRGCSRGCDFGGRGSLGGGRGSYGGRQSGFDKGQCQCKYCGEIITSFRSAKRNLIALNEHKWLILTLLPLVILLMLLQPLMVLLVLPLWYFHRLSMIDYARSSSLRTVIQ